MYRPASLWLACCLMVAASMVQGAEKVPPALNFSMTRLDGKPVDLKQYAGKVVLVVNVASQCGLTPQYEELQALHQKFASQGLSILGFPANEFGKQEPGTNEEIQKFCTEKYQVDFPLFSKIVVKGDGIAPLYQYLTDSETDPKFPGPIHWNFEKFLIGRDGQVVGRFDPKKDPSTPEVVNAIETALSAK
jgi:glutathione peroxidase